MRILRIAGRNLASLESFDLDFESEPLASVGLFAITGPTGAGKSTLLDALCAALYDKTPRLAESGGPRLVDVRGQENALLGANDIRSLLRRGAGSGWAEVVFVGNDEEHYLARWEVNRARGRSTGRLQNQKLSLLRVRDQKALGGTKTETLQAIEEHIGLTFDQFRRAALLAQGEFAALLKARAEDRAALLERMTGTELYGEISKQAHLEARIQKDILDGLERRLSEISSLPPEEKEHLQAALEGSKAESKESGVRQDAAQSAIKWWLEKDKLSIQVDSAKKAIEEATAAKEKSIPLQAELKAVEAARPMRPGLDAVNSAATAAKESRDRLDQGAQEVENATSEEALLQTNFESADASLAKAQEKEKEAEAGLREARRLDTQLESQKQTLSVIESKLREREELSVAAAETTDSAKKHLNNLEGERQSLSHWLIENEDTASIAKNWIDWKGLIRKCAEMRAEDEQSKKKIEQLERDLRSAEINLKQAEASGQGMRQKKEAAARALEAVLHELETLEASVSIERTRDLMEMKEQLGGIEATRSSAVKLRERQATLEEKAESIGREMANAREEASLAEKEAARLEVQLGEAQLAQQNLEARASLSDRRQLLREGEPCPLCGALEHPLAHDQSHVDDALKEQRDRVNALRKTSLETRQELSRQQVLARERKGQLEQVQDDAENNRQELDGLLKAWALEDAPSRKILIKINEVFDWGAEYSLPSPFAQEFALQVSQFQERVDEALAEAKKQGEEKTRIEKAAKKARETDAAAGQKLQKAELALQQATQEAQKQAERLGDAKAAQETIDERRMAAVLELEPLWKPRPEFNKALFEAPATLLEELEARTQAWEGKKTRFTELEQEISRVALELKHLEQALESRIAAKKETASEREEAQKGLSALREQRGQFFEGRPIDLVEKELKASVQEALNARNSAEEKWRAAQERKTSAKANLKNAEENRSRAEAQYAKARTTLAEGLERLGISEEELLRRLEFDDDWISKSRETLAEMERRFETARALLEKARAELDAHLDTDTPESDLEGSRASLEAARLAKEAADQRIGELKRRLIEDDEKQSRRAKLEEILARRRQAAEIWFQLDLLIGSADGKKFRQFAQGLTLDMLLAYANRHLEELARRYRIERVPDSDLDLQVIDRDMGDEIRSLNTLSGGETFLVSLAMALGLASLASNNTRIESLFIDEGFGTLDPETLDQAIAVLDGLQAGGRKVGVISHVPGLAERLGVQVRVRPQGAGRSSAETLSVF